MKSVVLVAALLVTGNVLAEEGTVEKAATKAVEDGPPACEAGHDDALKDGVVTIHPGETICVDLELRGKKVVPVAVVSVASPGKTLILKVWHEPGKPDTLLSVHNPFDAFLRYEAHMLVRGQAEAEYTSSCPVLSKRLGLEHWPYEIKELTLSGFKVLPETGDMVCS